MKTRGIKRKIKIGNTRMIVGDILKIVKVLSKAVSSVSASFPIDGRHEGRAADATDGLKFAIKIFRVFGMIDEVTVAILPFDTFCLTNFTMLGGSSGLHNVIHMASKGFGTLTPDPMPPFRLIPEGLKFIGTGKRGRGGFLLHFEKRMTSIRNDFVHFGGASI